jgi:hypothetical protein
MDLKEIEKMPEFECDIDPVTLSKLTPGDRLLAEAFSKLRQEVRWLGEKTITAHNLAVQTQASLMSLVKWCGATLGVIIVEEIARHLLTK